MTEVKGKPLKNKHKALVVSAFRNEISEQTRRVRLFSGRCGQGAEYHVGHDHQNNNAFADILNDFVMMKGLDLESLEIIKRKQREHHDYKHPYLQDVDIAKAWRDYHLSRADGLRMERAEDNLSSRK